MQRIVATLVVAAGWMAGCDSYGETVSPSPVADAATESDSGVTDAGAGEVSTDAGVRRVFVTSDTTNGGLGGLGPADKRCNEAANRPAAVPTIRGRYYRAWLSGAFEAAASRHHKDAARYLRSDDVQIAYSWSSFSDGELEAPINLDESGTEVTGEVWTGTKADGEETAATCMTWNSTSANDLGTVGQIGPKGIAWTESRQASCNSAARVYCIEY